MKLKQNSKSKKGEIPTDVGPALLNPAKKSRVSELGEEKKVNLLLDRFGRNQRSI